MREAEKQRDNLDRKDGIPMKRREGIDKRALGNRVDDKCPD